MLVGIILCKLRSQKIFKKNLQQKIFSTKLDVLATQAFVSYIQICEDFLATYLLKIVPTNKDLRMTILHVADDSACSVCN